MRKGPKISNHQLPTEHSMTVYNLQNLSQVKFQKQTSKTPSSWSLKTSDIWSLIASWHAYPPPNPRHHPRHSPKTLPHSLQWKSFIKEKAQHWKDQLLNPAAAALHLMKRCSLTRYLRKLSPLNDTNWPNSSKFDIVCFLQSSRWKRKLWNNFFPSKLPYLTSHELKK